MTPPSEARHDQIQIDYGFEYDFISPIPDPLEASEAPPDIGAGDEQDQAKPAYQFRLFTSRPDSANKNTREDVLKPSIRLSPTPPPINLSESLSLDKAHFVRPHRPDSYYFTSSLPTETLSSLKSQFAEVALSSSDVLSLAEVTKWPGSALPWRVINVKLAMPSWQTQKQTTPVASSLKSRKPSKKRRIILRRRLARAKEAAQLQKLAEETEKEKRTRRNREKKVKKKEREKRKKAETQGAETTSGIGREDREGDCVEA